MMTLVFLRPGKEGPWLGTTQSAASGGGMGMTGSDAYLRERGERVSCERIWYPVVPVVAILGG